jgi:hypothetical protein
MSKNQVWTLADPPSDRKAVECKWILLAIAAFHDYEILQMDVRTAFLNGNIDEDLYMM